MTESSTRGEGRPAGDGGAPRQASTHLHPLQQVLQGLVNNLVEVSLIQLLILPEIEGTDDQGRTIRQAWAGWGCTKRR